MLLEMSAGKQVQKNKHMFKSHAHFDRPLVCKD